MEELIRFYSNLLIIQYNNKPKAKATIELLVDELLADGLVQDVINAYNLDTAVGNQLDVLGQYIGIDRFYRGIELEGAFFSFAEDTTEWEETSTRKGFSTDANFNTKDGNFLTSDDVISGTLRLRDDNYRLLFKLKIVQNNINHSLKSIDDGLSSFFGSNIRVDDIGNMSIIYFVKSEQRNIFNVALQKGVVPKPMGVRINYIINSDVSYFGFANSSTSFSPFITGFSTDTDFNTKQGKFLTTTNLETA